MNLISYWKNSKEIHTDDGLVLIVGWYDHKNKQNGGHKALGVHWGDYPQSRGILSPCVIPEATRSAILSGLLHQAVSNGNSQQVQSITEAIEFFNEPA
ncbi:hypothetical protein ACSZNR_18375 [Aeromonas caviae]|uniref:hypothetical protein n=1 Tax=Aeromonas TaxID=642 RepID=UPI000DE5BA95|nr:MULTISPECIES: hypothetical protein [Aeromonas]MDH1843361.1 hypothetical protein [Aeromonas caviae]MDU4188785.1 hypothetical protein [Aeromonas sp.]MDX7748170.1 hypothetical protein [Aeromonas caviae]MDX7866545.1 hypothetical protein [Aeromonas caviae]UCM48795.1 hypothetical protein LEO79_17580 [Aeromonas caviae]